MPHSDAHARAWRVDRASRSTLDLGEIVALGRF